MVISQALETTFISSNVTDNTPALTNGKELKELRQYQKDHMIYTATKDITYDSGKPVEEQNLIPYMPTLPYRILDARTETIVKQTAQIEIKFRTSQPATDIGIANVVAGLITIKPPSGAEIEIIPNNTIGKWHEAIVTVIERGDWPSGEWEVKIAPNPQAGYARVSFVVPAAEVMARPTYDNLKFGQKSRGRIVEREYGTPDIIKRHIYAVTEGEFPVINEEEEEQVTMFARNVTTMPFLLNPADVSYSVAPMGAKRASMYVGIFTQVMQKDKDKKDPDALTEYTFRSEATI